MLDPLVAIGIGLLGSVYTKQHYVVDVIAGALEAFVAYVLFLRTYPREAVPEIDRRRAPVRALVVAAIYGITIAGFWVAYRIQLR